MLSIRNCNLVEDTMQKLNGSVFDVFQLACVAKNPRISRQALLTKSRLLMSRHSKGNVIPNYVENFCLDVLTGCIIIDSE